MRRSGVRIPLPPVFARVVVESEDRRAGALAKADIFDRATSTQRATTRQASSLIPFARGVWRVGDCRAGALAKGGHYTTAFAFKPLLRKLMQNTKTRGQGDLGSKPIGIGSFTNPAAAGKIGGVIVNGDLLRWRRDRRLSFGLERVV
jgi:hypothetical protein